MPPDEADPPLPPPVPAATVVVVRDPPGARPGLEVLLLRRREGGSFSGLWVFPGGRVDPEDREPDAGEQAAARRAAVREAAEEAGIALDPDDLVPFAHWSPPPIQPKRFATWFFLARDAGHEVTVDGHEIHEHDWVAPAMALERFAAGTIGLAPPTFVTLSQLAQQPTVDDALADATAHAAAPPVFASRPAQSAAGPVLLWAGDAAYEGGDPDRPGPRHRVVMVTPWRYERRP